MSDWRNCRWGDLAILEYGKALRGYENADGDYPVYGTNGCIGKHSIPLCDHPGVIIGRKGAYRGIHYSNEPFFVIDTAFYLKPKIEIDLKWTYYELLTHDINGMDSGSAIPSTSRDAFYNLPVRVPPLPEQRAIARILGSLDDKIEANRRMNETLEAIARAVFKSWFVDFDPVRAKAEGREPAGMDAETAALFPDSFEETELGMVPKGWDFGTVGAEFDLTMGQSPPGDTYNESGEGMVFYQGRTDFSFRYPSVRMYCTAPTRKANPGDTLVCVRAPVGDINMASEKCCIGRGLSAIRHKSGSRSFTYYMMLSLKEVFAQFEAEGTVYGSINKKDFEEIPCIIPQSEVVQKYETIVYPLDQMIENDEKEARILAAIRDSLLPELLSGDVRVNKFRSVEIAYEKRTC